MITITLTQGTNAVSVSGSLVYGSDFVPVRLNQIEQKAADGTDIIIDLGPTEIRGALIIKGASLTDGEALRTWLETKTVFAKETFTISGVSEVNLGNGPGVAISTAAEPLPTTSNARYNGGPTLEGVFEKVAPGVFNIKLPYRFLR
jgi:hypothetical protein